MAEDRRENGREFGSCWASCNACDKTGRIGGSPQLNKQSQCVCVLMPCSSTTFSCYHDGSTFLPVWKHPHTASQQLWKADGWVFFSLLLVDSRILFTQAFLFRACTQDASWVNTARSWPWPSWNQWVEWHLALHRFSLTFPFSWPPFRYFHVEM